MVVYLKKFPLTEKSADRRAIKIIHSENGNNLRAFCSKREELMYVRTHEAFLKKENKVAGEGVRGPRP